MALGLLFLGGGAASLGTSDAAVAALLLALYPRLPTTPQDNRCHLQVRPRTRLRVETLQAAPPGPTRLGAAGSVRFSSDAAGCVACCLLCRCSGAAVCDTREILLQAMRHLYVLAAEPRCLAASDIETRAAVPAPLRLHLAPQRQGAAAVCTDVDAPCLIPGPGQVLLAGRALGTHLPNVPPETLHRCAGLAS